MHRILRQLREKDPENQSWKTNLEPLEEARWGEMDWQLRSVVPIGFALAEVDLQRINHAACVAASWNR